MTCRTCSFTVSQIARQTRMSGSSGIAPRLADFRWARTAASSSAESSIQIQSIRFITRRHRPDSTFASHQTHCREWCRSDLPVAGEVRCRRLPSSRLPTSGFLQALRGTHIEEEDRALD